MIYSLLVLSPPGSGRGCTAAAHFAEALLERGHELFRVFFLDDGTLTGSASAVMPQDEFDVTQRWVELAEKHNLDLVLCVSSALKRGLLDSAEAKRYEKDAVTVHPRFEISGMGQLAEATMVSDRVVSFGG